MKMIMNEEENENVGNLKLYTSPQDSFKSFYVHCECHNPEHAMLVAYYDDDIELFTKEDADDPNKYPPLPELTFNLQLSPYLGFFKRIWVAIRYVFGFDYRRGHWNCCMVNEKHARMIIKYCNAYLNDTKRVKELCNGNSRKIY